MKKELLIIIMFLLVNTACGQQFTDSDLDYFGQNPPGDSAVIFAPGIFSLPDRLESRITFSQDGKEIYFEVIEIENNKVSNKIYYTQYLNNSWTEQVEVPFSTNNNVGKPYLSADGERLFFTKDGDIWMIERAGQGWSEPQPLPSPINSTSTESSYMETADGVAYISSKRPGGFGGIDNWRINRLSDQSLQAENLGSILNSTSFDFSPFIAPDGSYLIFGSDRNGRSGRAHLYISFNKGNDEWTAPINMNSSGAEVNNETANHNSPIISPDGKFLFFVRHETINVMDVYWVNANIIDKLREESGLTP
ncbi:MAG: hypothetical protein MUO54_10775 [Anaerolineales bacterium]|nr:hypothetical protein [Anaerolineales bacterium]